MKLAHIAYSDLPQANRDAFVQSVNDLGLHHQLPLANQMHRNRGNSRQVEIEPTDTAADREAEPSATAAVGQLIAASKVAQLTDMLAKLIATLTHQTPVGTAYEPPRPLAPPPEETVSFCWECGNQGHFQRYCPFLAPGLNYCGPQMFPPPASRRS